MMPFDTPPPSVPPTLPRGSNIVQHASEHTVRFVGPALPHTGVDIFTWVLVGVALLVIGVVFMAYLRATVRDEHASRR
jgi:hypothetical protein